MYLNLHEYKRDFILFYVKLFDLFRIYMNLYEHVLNLFENMHSAGLPHTAAPLDSRTLPRALPDSPTLLPTLPHTAALPDTGVRYAAHCRTLPHTA